MLAMMQTMAVEDNNPPNEDVQPPLAQPSANTVVQDSIQYEILRLLQDITAARRIGGVDQGRKGRAGGRAGRARRAGRGKGGRNCNRRTSDNANFAHRLTNIYR